MELLKALKKLSNTPPWDWPESAGTTLLAVLRNPSIKGEDRLLAAELAGDEVVINEELVDALLSILRSSSEEESLRGTAAIALGPVLEICDTEDFEDPDAAPITERTFHALQESLHALYQDSNVPEEVRRRILEAAVRAPRDWHEDAVRAAYASANEKWKLTAVFCMHLVPGFDEQILASLDSRNPAIHFEAVRAAGAWELDAAWPHVVDLVTAENTEKQLLLAAIEAVGSLRPDEAFDVLEDLEDSDDPEIAEAVAEATSMSAAGWDEDGEDEDEDEEDEDEER